MPAGAWGPEKHPRGVRSFNPLEFSSDLGDMVPISQGLFL